MLKKIIQIVLSGMILFSQLNFVAFSEGIVSQPLYGRDMPDITPPAVHPRVLFNQEDVNLIKSRMGQPQNNTALAEQQALAADECCGNLPEANAGSTNRNMHYLAVIQAKAFDYAINGNQANGENAIAALNQYIDTYTFRDPMASTVADYYYPSHVIYVAALVYDWCYPLLRAEDKEALVCNVQQKLAKELNFGWPLQDHINALTGYGNLTMILRDFLAFGIAVYDEYPDIYNYVASIILTDFKEARNYWYRSHSHNQGTHYGILRNYTDLCMQWLFKAMSGEEVLNRNLYQVPYQYLYYYLPNDQHFREGDDDFVPIGELCPDRPSGLLISSLLASTMNNDPYLKGFYEHLASGYSYFSYDYISLTPAEFLIFNNPDLQPQDMAQLPRTRYFGSPNGMMVARTGWNREQDGSEAVAFMKIGENYFSNHQHFDAGTFQIYYKGMLSPSLIHYNRTDNDQYSVYNIQTIAHNGLLIYDPNEIVYRRNNNDIIANSGGQKKQYPDRMETLLQWKKQDYRTGTVLGSGYGPDSSSPAYSYISGDITNAYTDKVSEVRRSMMFMPTEDENVPAVFFVMDKIKSKSPDFKKVFLLHSMEEPQVNGNTIVIQRTSDGYDGQLIMQTLYPKNPVIEKIGGAGKQWLIEDTNYPPLGISEDDLSYGWGRVEVSPSEKKEEDYFLNVICCGDSEHNDEANEADLIENEQFLGARIQNKIALFSKQKERIHGEVSFAVQGQESADIAVSGLEAGTWLIYLDDELLQRQNVADESGVLYISAGQSGNYTLRKDRLQVPVLKEGFQWSQSFDGTENYAISWEAQNDSRLFGYQVQVYEEGNSEPVYSVENQQETEFMIPSSLPLNRSYTVKVTAKAAEDDQSSDSAVLTINTMFAGGDGNDTPFVISNERQFQNIAAFPEASFLVNQDLDLTNYTPLGTFSGKLRGFNADKTEEEMRSICLEMQTSSSADAGLFSCLDNGAEIKNIRLTGTVSAPNAVNTGGFAGRIADSAMVTVSDCINEAEISGSYTVGGIIGRAFDGASNIVLRNLHNKGNIMAAHRSYSNAGGIVGISGTFALPIENCSNTGNVSGAGQRAGGIAGCGNKAQALTSCYNVGEVTVYKESPFMSVLLPERPAKYQTAITYLPTARMMRQTELLP